MSKSYNLNDTIAAIATPVGSGGIGIVRLSGPGALGIADKVFFSTVERKPSSFSSHTVHHGEVRSEDGLVIDEVLLTVMRAPKSYTGEDVVEISGHGGPVVLKAVLSLVLRQGARLAEPGEFTKRAFLNGRMDLVQAEAVLDIIQAKAESSLKVSTNQLKGELTKGLETIRTELMALYTQLEAVVNFPEEGIGVVDEQAFTCHLLSAEKKVEELLTSSDEGRILREGVRLVLCGKTNVGKSSLLNVLLKQSRAIVSPLEGTTRDTIEETVQIQGIPFQLVDTAGILAPRDLIEQEAVKRSQMFMQSADLVLFVLDGSVPLSVEDEQIRVLVLGKEVLVVVNKSDLVNVLTDEEIKKFFPGSKILRVSALQKAAILSLQEAIVAAVLHGKPIAPHRILVTNLRHVQSLRECHQAVIRAQNCLQQKVPLEFLSEELKAGVNALDAITGRNVDADLLEQIFSHFCVGK